MSIDFYATTSQGRVIPARSPNLSNGNAAAVLRAMGLVETEDDLWNAGREVPLADFRRACLRALNSDRAAGAAVREPWEDHAPGRPAVYMGGIDVEGIRTRARTLLDWAERAAADGATAVYWG